MKSRQRLIVRVRELLRGARGRSLYQIIVQLNAVLRGWAAYYRLTDHETPLKVIDGWVRRKLRCVLWRQWKGTYTRARKLMHLGLTREHAWRAATTGYGPWWNSGASPMHIAVPKRVFDQFGLVSLLDTVRRLQRLP